MMKPPTAQLRKGGTRALSVAKRLLLHGIAQSGIRRFSAPCAESLLLPFKLVTTINAETAEHAEQTWFCEFREFCV
jgi:hypothetical protein